MVYFAKIYKDSDNKERISYSVEFPDIEGALTYGNTLEMAKYLAKECLNLCLEEFSNHNIKKPKIYNEKNMYPIEVERNIAFALNLRWNREDLGLTQKDMAEKLKINLSAYQRLEDTKKSNPTLKTISKVENALKKELITVV